MIQNVGNSAEKSSRILRSLFAGRPLTIATMHGKEAVIAPLLEEYLGVKAVLPAAFDTDAFGTFSGEIPREHAPLDTARRKALAAMERTGTTLAVASEGSFGAHPQLFFMPADSELVLLVDRENEAEWMGHVVSTRTNFAGETVTEWEALELFARQAGFPEHGLIVREDSADPGRWLVKGITSSDALRAAARQGWARFGHVVVETDMRALYNPTRMGVIAEATRQLLEKMAQLCPQCDWPGFAVVERHPGLPCADCGLPTRQTLRWKYVCGKCGHPHQQDFPEGRSAADPTYCDFCNP